MIKKQSHTIFNTSQLSSFLFWDVDVNKIDVDKNKKWLIHRVLEYGLLSDWLFVQKYYGVQEIAYNALTMKDLDKKSVSFISALSNIPKEKFLCYSTPQLNNEHWNF